MTTLGVEEEYVLVAQDSLRPESCVQRVLELARSLNAGGEGAISPELLQAQIEIATPVCTQLGELGTHLSRMRRIVADAAARAGCRAAMTGAVPQRALTPVPVTEGAAYRELGADTPAVIHEHPINGMHVHIGVSGRDHAVMVLNRVRPWLPVLTGMAANSPLWDGRDTGFASWRTIAYGRWPVGGPPPHVADAADYDRRAEALLAAGVIRGRGQIYWQARLSERYPTVEVRAMDTQLRVDEAVMFAGVVRALAATAVPEDRTAGGAGARGAVPHEVLAGAVWRAARDGLDGTLLHPFSLRQAPAGAVVAELVDHIGPALKRADDLDVVTDSIGRLLVEGTGARRQRAALREGGEQALADLVTGGGASR